MQTLLRRLWIQITADRKRFTVLCAMLAIGLLLWGRIIVTSNVPRTAIADPKSTGTNTNGTPAPLHPDPSASSDKPERRTVRVALATLPIRDPLLISNRHFPKPTPVELLDPDDPKSGPNAAENQQQADARAEELRALVDKFRLEAVMQGRPMAVINGKTYKLYSWIPAIGRENIRFQLVQVGHRSVILEAEDHRFKVKMGYPGSEER